MDNQQRAKDQERLAFTHSEKKQTNKQNKTGNSGRKKKYCTKKKIRKISRFRLRLERPQKGQK